MREIKFRAWGKRDKKMYYDVGMSEDKVFSELPCYGSWSGMVIDVEDCLVAVMQYTGLKDKNCVEIYEGDITENEYDSYVVIFEDGCFRFDSGTRTLPMINSNTMLIIGNIYENKELVEGKA